MLIFLTILTTLLMLGDTITTILCVENGATEINPISNFLIENHLFVFVKILLTIGLASCLIMAMKLDKTSKIIVAITSLIVNIPMCVAVINNVVGLIINT